MAEVESAIRDAGLEAERTCSGWRVPWGAVASALTTQCPFREVEAHSARARRRRQCRQTPRFRRPATHARSKLKHVELPRWQTLMFARLAARERSDPGDYLSRHLLDLAACESEFLTSEIPGFLETARWPEGGSG